MADSENKLNKKFAIWIHIKTANKRTILNFIFSIFPTTLKIPSNIKDKKDKLSAKNLK